MNVLKNLTVKYKKTMSKNKKIEYNPEKNPNVISIIRQEDGNYKGYTQKNGKLIEVREGTPHDVIVALITHP